MPQTARRKREALTGAVAEGRNVEDRAVGVRESGVNADHLAVPLALSLSPAELGRSCGRVGIGIALWHLEGSAAPAQVGRSSFPIEDPSRFCRRIFISY